MPETKYITLDNLSTFKTKMEDVIDTTTESAVNALPEVARTGDYDDLSNTPTRLTDFINDLPGATDYSETYNITYSVTNGTYVGARWIEDDGTELITITADTGYVLPSTVNITGATHTYNESTGVITLSAPTGAVTITAVCGE